MKKLGYAVSALFTWVAVLTALLGSSTVHAVGPPSLDGFLQEHGLADVFESNPLLQVMANRWDSLTQAQGYLYGLVAYNDKNNPVRPGLLDSFCRMALLRDKMKPIRNEIFRRTNNDLLIRETLRIAVVESRFKKYERLGRSREQGWSICACRVRSENITLPDITPKMEAYLARASYNLAKRHLMKGDKEAALEWFKKTRTTGEVYDNSLAFLVVLIHGPDPDLAARIDKRYLRLDRIDDPRALAYLARFRITQKGYGLAVRACKRCLEVKPGDGECFRLLDLAKDAQTRAALGFEDFFAEQESRD